MTAITVFDYLNKRNSATYGKALRVLSNVTRKNCGSVSANFHATVVNVKITEKIIFIFIDK